MKVKVSELQGTALDWAVAKCEGNTFSRERPSLLASGFRPPKYSTDWAQGGPIIEREMLDVHPMCPKPAWAKEESWSAHTVGRDINPLQYGPTPLIAAMRCHVASKLGETVDVPNELME